MANPVIKKLINKNGRSVTYVKFSRDVANAGQPWRGRTESLDSTFDAITVFVEPGTEKDLGQAFVRNDGTSDVDMFGFVAAEDVPTDDLEEYSLIRDGAVSWHIERVKLLKPGTERLLYEVHLRTKK